MEHNLWTTKAALALCATIAIHANAQVVKNERLLSFEDGQVPAFITGSDSRLEINDEHYKDGTHSLSWTFNPGAVLSIKKDLTFEPKDPTGKDTYLSACIVWVYNEQAQDKQITFECLKDGKKCTSFPFGINFTGWRGAWVCYERDMEGTPEVGMNEIRILAPDVKGRLFIDHLIPASKVDARQQTADVQVPFVNKETTNHWLVIYKHSLMKPDIPLTPVTDKQREEIRLMEQRFRYLRERTIEELRRHVDFRCTFFLAVLAPHLTAYEPTQSLVLSVGANRYHRLFQLVNEKMPVQEVIQFAEILNRFDILFTSVLHLAPHAL